MHTQREIKLMGVWKRMKLYISLEMLPQSRGHHLNSTRYHESICRLGIAHIVYHDIHGMCVLG